MKANSKSNVKGLNRLKRRVSTYLDRAIGGAALIAVHEANALHGHWSEASERTRVARKARGPRELLRDQVDLLPESKNRLSRDHEVRVQLWRGLVKDLSAPVRG